MKLSQISLNYLEPILNLYEKDAPDSTIQHFKRTHIKGLNLQNRNFAFGDFTACDWTNAHLEGVDLRYANLTYTKLIGNSIDSNLQLSHANLSHATLADWQDFEHMQGNRETYTDVNLSHAIVAMGENTHAFKTLFDWSTCDSTGIRFE